MAPRPLIIDADPGKDDAVAILLALASPEELDVVMLGAAAGNVGLDHTTANLLRLRELAGRTDIPVHAGCPRPIMRTLATVPHIHGADGLGGAELPPPAGAVSEPHAVAALIEAVRASPVPVTIAGIAPLTNIAVALVMAPDIVGQIREIAVMGGSFSGGNITPHATFNVFNDPHAADIVFRCGAPVTMIGLDVTRNTMPTREWCEQLRATGTPFAKVVADLWREPTAFMNDACVIAHLIAPDLLRCEPHRIAIETDACEEIGRTTSVAGEPNAAVATGIDREGFFELLMDRLARP
ncbi:nucleoside hydrolase [Microbaculum marinum]|uniref:Nucleoside hydrolase n=1 Tax=Microbaculum marinum TaxID=1764581 RepID=A0AAW9RK93_9HYPH